MTAAKRLTYAAWRAAVLRGMIARDIAKSITDAERILRESERGPTACVPSPKELWRDGEWPEAFVQHEYLSHQRTETSERKMIMDYLKKLVGGTIVSASLVDGIPIMLVECAAAPCRRGKKRHSIKFSAVPGHVEFKETT
jgi:hypothetical protein